MISFGVSSPLTVLQPLAPLLSAVLLALVMDVLLRLLAGVRDHVDPLLGIPSGMANWLQRKLNRVERSRVVLLARGRIALMAMVVLGVVLGWLSYGLGMQFQWMGALIWFSCYRLTFGWTASVELLKIANLSDKEFVSKGLAVLQRRRVTGVSLPARPDRHAVIRAMIEAMALSLHRGWLSAVLWAMAGVYAGIPPLVMVVAVTCLLEGERIVTNEAGYAAGFAQAFEVIETVINFVPARIAALFWVLGAVFTPGARPLTALRAMFVHSSTHRALNDGWPMAAVAGALGVALHGGKKGTKDASAWVGPKNATAKAGKNDLKRILWLHAATVAVTALVLVAMLFLALAS